jgi:hypothetical protein
MAITFNERSISAEPLGKAAKRQPLLTQARFKGTKILLDRIVLEADSNVTLEVATDSLVWFQMLEGEARLNRAESVESLTASHIVLLPPGFKGSIQSSSHAALLMAEVPKAAQFDADFTANPPSFRMIDWTREPMLDSEHDARKRIYVVTPKLFGTKAIKGEMIIYPPGTEASNHHHEGAEHFMYVTQGRGVAYANESPIPVQKGDIIYYADRERHYLRSEGDEPMIFVEFFVPGEYKTIWVPGAAICTWSPTGKSLSGEKPVREIAKHSSALVESPQDV